MSMRVPVEFFSGLEDNELNVFSRVFLSGTTWVYEMTR